MVATHVRSLHRNTQDLVLDHYLEVLARRPGALPAATALVTARAAGLFTLAHEASWVAARRQHGDAAGTSALIEVLLHRGLPFEAVVAGMTAAVGMDRCDPALVAIEARRHLEPTASPAPVSDGEVVIVLAEYERPTPTLHSYDQLLTPSDRVTDPTVVRAG